MNVRLSNYEGKSTFKVCFFRSKYPQRVSIVQFKYGNEKTTREPVYGRVGPQLADLRERVAEVEPSRVVFQPDPTPDSIDTDLGQVMTQLQAQAGRRRGSRRN